MSRSGRYDFSVIEKTLDMLASGKPLPQQYQNHFLSGTLAKYEECHIHGDLLLLYKKDRDEKIIVLYNIGTHSELFEE